MASLLMQGSAAIVLRSDVQSVSKHSLFGLEGICWRHSNGLPFEASRRLLSTDSSRSQIPPPSASHLPAGTWKGFNRSSRRAGSVCVPACVSGVFQETLDSRIWGQGYCAKKVGRDPSIGACLPTGRSCPIIRLNKEASCSAKKSFFNPSAENLDPTNKIK